MTDIETLLREFKPQPESGKHIQQCLRIIARGQPRTATPRWIQWGMAAALGGSLVLNAYLLYSRPEGPVATAPRVPVLEVTRYDPEMRRYEHTIQYE